MQMKLKKWNTYIMVDNKKVYLKKEMSTVEAIAWLEASCQTVNGNHFMCDNQVYCESY